jgi:hypothetical protein
MTARRIEVHLDREGSTKETVWQFEAFGRIWYYHGIISKGIDRKEVVAVYLPGRNE